MTIPPPPGDLPANPIHRASQRMPMFGVREDRTAVVVVHGVGASEPGATASGFAAAMVNTMRARGAPAPMFERYNFQLPLHGVKAPPREDGALPAEDVLLRRQLDDYAGAAANETMEVPAFAIRPGGDKVPPIDVYGAWWGDIGSFGEGPVRAALYVLRFVSRFFSLGLTSVEAAADTTGTRFWYQTEWWHKTFSRLVFGVIPTVFLLNILVVIAVAYRNVSMDVALRVSLVAATIITVAMMLPQILRSGKSGPMDWFARPGLYAIVVLFLIGLVDANRVYAEDMPLYRWLTPVHLMAIIWLMTGAGVVYLVRSVVSIGTPAPRWPRSAPPVPPAERLAARSTPRAKFVDLTWLATMSLTLPLSVRDVEVQAGSVISLALFVTLVTAPFRPWLILGWWRHREVRAQLRAHLLGNWSRRAGVALAAGIIHLFIGGPAVWLAFAATAAVVLTADVRAFYRDKPFRGHVLPGFGGAAVIAIPALVFWQIAAVPDVASSTIGCAAFVVTMTILELFSRLDAWWSQPQESPAYTDLSTHGRWQRARVWGQRNYALVFVVIAGAWAALNFLSIAVTPPPIVELGMGPNAAVITDRLTFDDYSQQVLRQAVVHAFGYLSGLLNDGLLFSWGAALLIVSVALIVAVYVTLRAVARWSDQRYLATTTWTSVITASGTIVGALLIQSLMIQFSSGDYAARWLERNATRESFVSDSITAATIGLPPANVELLSRDPATSLWRERFWQRLDSPALVDDTKSLMETMKLLHEWAGVQLLGVLAFALLFGAATAWTLFPALRMDANLQARPWGNSLQLGRWSTTGADVMRVSLALGFPALAIVPVVAAIYIPAVYDAANVVNAWLFTFLFGAGGLVALSQLGLIVTVLRPALALAADIEIYMRVAPHDRTPRARLMDRMTSLLTHLEASGYSRIVVVAHSQGTVVAADALRLRGRLAAQAESPAATGPGTQQPRVSLITMGSPLQNLYASAFPYLFSWVQDTDADTDDGSVNAKRVGVDQWINLYKSGDYIGRYLWFSGTDEARFADNSADVGTLSGEGKSFDTCIGYGGHTGYWSHPAVLDAVLAQAAMPVRT